MPSQPTEPARGPHPGPDPGLDPDLDATVVVPALNAGHLIHTQLDALAGQQTSTRFEVVVADNGSTDDTAATALRWSGAFRGLRVVDASTRRGVSHARNVGARAARSPLVMFCDADDAVDPGWVQAMGDALSGADLAGGPLDPHRLSEPDAVRWRYVPPPDALPITMRFLPYATGCNLGITTALFAELGGFDESYIGGHEEVDLCWRAQLAGHTIAFAPEAVVHYRLRADLRAVVRQTFGYGRSYAQLFSHFRDEEIPRTPWKREVNTYLILMREALHHLRGPDRNAHLATLAWTAGRLAGDVAYRVRCPL